MGKNKMFNVMVLGGAMMASAHAQGLINPQLPAEPECKVELTQNHRFGKEVTCLDDMDQDASLKEIIEEINKPDPNCLTPFCGCWLG